MTYIKPDTVSDQSSWVREILDQGAKAAQQQDWQQVIEQIKLLPQEKISQGQTEFALTTDDWQQGSELALQALLTGDFSQRWEITKILPLFGPRILPKICGLVNEPTQGAEVQWFSCKVLGSFPQQETVLALLELLQNTSEPELSDAAAQTLVSIGDYAVAPLVELLPQPEYRTLAVESLSLIRTSATISPLLEVAQDPDQKLRMIALQALGSFHDPRIAPMLVKALQDPASAVRKAAVQALSFRPELCQELNLVIHLAPLLGDLNLEICMETAIALGRMKQRLATQILFDALQKETTPLELKLSLIKALGRSEIIAGVSYLQETLAKSETELLPEVIVTLGRIATPQLKPIAATVLLDFWQKQQLNCDQQTKQVLATALGELRESKGHATLEQLAQDSDRKVQLHAQAALRKLN